MRRVLYLFVFLFSLFMLNNRVNAYTEYKVGDIVKYNDIEFYVIKNSSSKETSVTVLKKEPLSVAEVNQYGIGHVNRYTSNSVGTASDQNGYGGMAYYSSATCGNVNGINIISGCITDYTKSDIKYVVDEWANENIKNGLQEARLIQYNEFENLGYVEGQTSPSDIGWAKSENTPSWVYNSNYWYWTMSPCDNSSVSVYSVFYEGQVGNFGGVFYHTMVVRPVITISKTALVEENINDRDNVEDNKANNTNIVDNTKSNNISSTKVKVDNTYLNQSIFIMIVGFVCGCVVVVILYIIKKKKGKNEDC